MHSSVVGVQSGYPHSQPVQHCRLSAPSFMASLTPTALCVTGNIVVRPSPSRLSAHQILKHNSGALGRHQLAAGLRRHHSTMPGALTMRVQCDVVTV